jgi:predicted nucleic acid-binding Zn ribbon protein
MKGKQGRQGDLTPLGNIIPGVLEDSRTLSDSELIRIWDIWEGIVGKVVAENARPAAFKGTLILVYVDSPAWMHHLQFLKAELIQKLNEGLGKPLIEDMKFKIGPL